MVATRIRGVRLTREERLEVRRMIDRGCSFEEAASAVRCSTKTIQRVLDSVGGMRPQVPNRSPRQLCLAEREEISRELRHGETYREIARRLGRSPSTVCREVNRNGRSTPLSGIPGGRICLQARTSAETGEVATMSTITHPGGVNVDLTVVPPADQCQT